MIARKKVATSRMRIPFKPISGSSAPASMGEKTEGPVSISDIIPLARLYFSLGIMVLIAAEYAGH